MLTIFLCFALNHCLPSCAFASRVAAHQHSTTILFLTDIEKVQGCFLKTFFPSININTTCSRVRSNLTKPQYSNEESNESEIRPSGQIRTNPDPQHIERFETWPQNVENKLLRVMSRPRNQSPNTKESQVYRRVRETCTVHPPFPEYSTDT